MITAIIEKKDRVNAEDVRAMWVRDIKPESAGMVSEPFEAVLLAMANSQRTLRQTSDGLHQAYRARLARMKAFAAEMEAAG